MKTHIIEAARGGTIGGKTVLLSTCIRTSSRRCRSGREPVGWLPGGTGAPLRHREEGTPDSRAGEPGAVRPTFRYLIPTNLYGPGDKFHPSVSHVIPARIKRCVEAKGAFGRRSNSLGHRYPLAASTSLSDDAAEAIVLASELYGAANR